MCQNVQTLKGKTALVTGASSGFGRDIALDLAERGCSLILTGRNKEALADVTGHCLQDSPPKVITKACDLGDEASVKDLAETIKREFGTLDIIINNAGLGYGGTVVDSDPVEMRAMIDVNIWGAYLVAHYCLPLLPEKGPGDLVNIASVSSFKTEPAFAMYCASKAALRTMSEAMRRQYCGNNIRVSCVYPGKAETGFWNNMAIEGQKMSQEQMDVMMRSADISQAVMQVLEAPEAVCYGEVVVRPTWQEL